LRRRERLAILHQEAAKGISYLLIPRCKFAYRLMTGTREKMALHDACAAIKKGLAIPRSVFRPKEKSSRSKKGLAKEGCRALR